MYERRFYFKYRLLQNTIDRKNIIKHTIDIANHPDPDNIGECESCDSVESMKVTFNTGGVIIYQVRGSEVCFVDFYRSIPD